nr:hypothetical protein [Kofleriaceae bacterium]
MSAADARWDGFLAKIRARADEILKEASDGTVEYLASPDFDSNALSQLWTAIRLRLIELWRKIDDTWSDSASALFSGDAGDRARERGQELAHQIERDHERAEVRAWAAVGRWIEKRAAAQRVTEAHCMRCGAPHPVVGVYAAHEWTCTSCHATATFQPATFEYQMPQAADYVARDRAFELRERPADYWPLYLATVAEVLPERAATLAADVAAKIASGDKPR